MLDNYDDVLAAGIDRRTLLKYAGAFGAATALTATLAACSGPAASPNGSPDCYAGADGFASSDRRTYRDSNRDRHSRSNGHA